MQNENPNKSRRWFVAAGLATAGAVAAGAWWQSRRKPYLPTIDIEPGQRVLATYPSVDVHSHPGRSFLAGAEFDSAILSNMPSGFEADRVIDMRSGNVTASLFSIVADVKVLGISASSGIVVNREFEEGEVYADFERQLGHFAALADSDTVSFALSADDIRDAHRNNKSVAVLACEGADFVENDLQRLTRAYDAGVRSVTLVHYRPTPYGDSQTAAPVHGGLSPLGAELVAEMNRLGIVIDLAHASFETVRDSLEISSAPVMVSHSHLQSETVPNARLISPEHAKIVAESGGVIGSWPAGITSRTMSDFVDETLRLVDLIGIDHVSIGTDLDANYKPVLTDYAQFPELAAMLLARGLSEQEAGKILGLNFLRVFDAVAAARQI